MRISISTPLAALLCLAAVLCAGTSSAGAAGWEVIVERDGIIVSQRPAAGRKFPRLRAVGAVDGTPYEVLAILQDVPAYVHWLPDCVESSLVRTIDARRSVIYMRTDVPNPVADRDIVPEHTVTILDAPDRLRLAFRAIPWPDIKPQPGVVRMQLATGSYLVEAIDDSRARVTYEVDADPGGELPDWLVTMQSSRNPLETIAGLRRRLEQTRGHYREQIADFPAAVVR
jgi:hypothetical protein